MVPSQKLVAVLLLTTTLQNCRQSNILLHCEAVPKVTAHQQDANTIASSNAFTPLQLVQTSAKTKLPTPISFSQTYLSAQGHQVRFLEQSGVWWADVQDIWKGVQRLLVICQPKKMPKQAIQELTSKTPDQHKYCVHILQTHEPLWTPGVVYVGALGVRGGGNASSSPRSNTDTHKNSVQTTTKDGYMSTSSSLPSFASPEEAQKAVAAYITRWQLATPSERLSIQELGESILSKVEQLKKREKRSYRRQVLGFETQDVDPLVWDRLLQAQRTTQAQLNTLRELRSQLLDTLPPTTAILEKAGIRTRTHKDCESVLYSSDEDEQQLSDQTIKNYTAFVTGVGQVLQKKGVSLAQALLDPSTTIEHCVQLLKSVPGIPKLLGDYIEKLLHETDEEKRAALLGSLLTEAILEVVPAPKGSIATGTIKKLGSAAHLVAHIDPKKRHATSSKPTSRTNPDKKSAR